MKSKISQFLHETPVFVKIPAAIAAIFAIVATIAISLNFLAKVNLDSSSNQVDAAQVNSVREGTVIDKTYSKGYVYYTTTYTMKVPVTKPNFIPGHWSMTISIEKDGQKTEKTIRVSEEEYNSYEIGDTYTFK